VDIHLSAIRLNTKTLGSGEELGDLSTIETEASVDEVKEAVSKLHRV